METKEIKEITLKGESIIYAQVEKEVRRVLKDYLEGGDSSTGIILKMPAKVEFVDKKYRVAPEAILMGSDDVVTGILENELGEDMQSEIGENLKKLIEESLGGVPDKEGIEKFLDQWVIEVSAMEESTPGGSEKCWVVVIHPPKTIGDMFSDGEILCHLKNYFYRVPEELIKKVRANRTSLEVGNVRGNTASDIAEITKNPDD